MLFPSVLEKYPGDALYSLVLSYADEISQIYQAPWINPIRATTLGLLVLGSNFSWLDMLSYTIGIAIVAPIEWLLLRRPRDARRR